MRRNDFYSRVAKHQKTNKWAQQTREFSDASQRVNKKSSKHFPWYDVFILYILRLFDGQHISKMGSHWSARASKTTKSTTWGDIQSHFRAIYLLLTLLSVYTLICQRRDLLWKERHRYGIQKYGNSYNIVFMKKFSFNLHHADLLAKKRSPFSGSGVGS